MEICSLLSHWLMQFTKKKCMREPSGFAAKKCAVKNRYVGSDLKVIAMLTVLQGTN